MRLLVLSPILPHPEASHGGAVYLGCFLEALGRRAETHLLSFLRPSELRWGSAPPPAIASSDTVLLPQRHDQRLPQVLAQKAKMLWSWGARRIPLAAAKHRTRAMQRAIRRALALHRPDVVLVEFAVMAQYLPLLAGHRTVLTDHECGGATARSIGPFRLGLARDRRLWREHARRWFPAADLVQAINAEDAAALAITIGRPVEVRPPVVPLPPQGVSPGQAPPRVLFLGDYSHPPNPPAARFLALDLLPRLRQRVPDAELWLAGPRAGRDVLELAGAPGVRIVGYASDLPALLGQVRLLAAPLFEGGGTRIKVLTALAHGLPVVANRLGRRGIDAPEPAVTTGESVDELVERVALLLERADFATRASQSARAWAQSHSSPDALAERQLARYAELRGEPPRAPLRQGLRPAGS
jgi:glycosyltransferase involved in cell wall biosynthesis